MQLNVAKEFTKKEDILEMGARLGVPRNTIELALNNNPTNLLQATTTILGEWRNTVSTDEEAFAKMYRALKAMNRQDVITNVLNQEPE